MRSPSASQVDDSILLTPALDGQATHKCKHCKKDIEGTVVTAHMKQCLKDKQERLQKKREAREAKDAKDAKDVKNAKDSDKDKEKEKMTDKNREIIADGRKEKDNKDLGTIDGVATEENDDASMTASNTKPNKLFKTTTPLDPSSSSKKDKPNPKKRKPTDDPVTASATNINPDKPPPTKKQKKKDAAVAPVGATTATATTAPAAADTGATAKAKATAKPKGPVDVEKQCGVPLANGAMCARSLTCKSHAMGAKRAVPGRSLPYDKLLAQYQKKNQAKQQKAALASAAPLADDLRDAGPVDSDEERNAVMAALLRAAPRPLDVRPRVSVRARYSNVRLREMLAGAMAGSRGAGLFSTAGGRGVVTGGFAAQSAAGEANAGGDVDAGTAKGSAAGSALGAGKHSTSTSILV